MSRGHPINDYQRGVIRRMVRQGCEELHRIARRAELDPATVRLFLLRELAARYQAEHKAAQIDALADRDSLD